MNRWSSLQIINIAAYVVTLIVNFFSQSSTALGLSIFPKTVAELGESRAIFFLPAGYVFAIWGIIYFGLGAYVIYQGRSSQRNNPILDKIGYWFLLSSIGNVTWLVLFLFEQTALSTLAMFLILGSLIMIYLRLGVGRTPVSRAERWAVHIPFGIYLGWITVATVANISAALYEAGYITEFAGISADLWAGLMMLVAAGITLLMLWRHGAVDFALVVVWALVGIFVRPFDTPLYAQQLANLNAGLVNTVAVVLAVAIAAGIGFSLVRQLQAPGRTAAA